jgi:hypothetical protein
LVFDWRLMYRLVTVLVFALFGAGCGVTSQAPGHITEQPVKRQICSSVIASHRPILEAMFERELYGVTYEDEWHGALKSLRVATSDPSGGTRDPRSVLQSAIDKLLQVQNVADRRRLEYLLLGSRMSLEERNQFDEYCVATAP